MYCMGPGTVEGDDGDEVVELAWGATSRSASRMPGLSNWKTPVESPRASIA